MYPLLYKFGPLELRSWGLAIAVSFLVATFVSMKRASRFGVKPEAVVDMAIVIIITSILGSRIWYVFNHLDRFQGAWLDTINPFRGDTIGFSGFAMNGGVVLALAGSFLYITIRKWNFWNLGDTIAPTFLLGAGIHRLFGCFLNGCCYGLPTTSFLGVAFPKNLGPFPAGTPLWPSQLFSSAFGFLGFALVCLLEKRLRRPGLILWLGLGYYSAERFLVDQFRYYPPNQILGNTGPLTFTTNHLLVGGLFLLAAIFFVRGLMFHHEPQR